MRLTDDERREWLAAKARAERQAVVRRIRARERAERAEERLLGALERSLADFARANRDSNRA